MLNLREGAGTLVYYRALERVLSFWGVQDVSSKISRYHFLSLGPESMVKPYHRPQCWLYHLLPMGLSTRHFDSLKQELLPYTCIGSCENQLRFYPKCLPAAFLDASTTCIFLEPWAPTDKIGSH